MVYDQNLAKIQEVAPSKRDAFYQAHHRSWSLNRQFRILSILRTASQQHALWLKGRNAAGKIIDIRKVVTYKDGYIERSEHQDGLACDIMPLNCTYADVADAMVEYGVEHPFTTGAFIDLPHLSLLHAHTIIVPPTVTTVEQQKAAAVKQIQSLSGNVRERAITRYYNLYGEAPNLM